MYFQISGTCKSMLEINSETLSNSFIVFHFSTFTKHASEQGVLLRRCMFIFISYPGFMNQIFTKGFLSVKPVYLSVRTEFWYVNLRKFWFLVKNAFFTKQFEILFFILYCSSFSLKLNAENWFQLSHWDGSNRDHLVCFCWDIKKSYLWIIPVTPSYLELYW